MTEHRDRRMCDRREGSMQDETTSNPDRPAMGVTRRRLIVGGAAASGAAAALPLFGRPTPASAEKGLSRTGPAGLNYEYMMTTTSAPSNTISAVDYDYLTYPHLDLSIYKNVDTGAFDE